jgi:ABC-type polysaccharide/polyol phosphate export permease
MCIRDSMRDVPHLLQIGLPFLLWTAPIIYVPHILPPWLRDLVVWHPLFPPIDLLQRLVLATGPADAVAWLRAAGVALVAMAIGILTMRRFDHEVRDVL